MNTGARKEPIYNRIAGELRSSIARQFRPGDMLPSEHQLANRYAIHRNTVRQAMDVLAREGLIRRHPGQGTVVLDRTATGELAIVVRPNILSSGTHAYYNFVCQRIGDLLQERNRRWSVKVHIGAHAETGSQFPATLDLLEPDVLKRLRGVISFHPLYEVEPKLRAAQVPVVCLLDDTAARTESVCVGFARKNLYTHGVAHLKAAGCKTIGLLRHSFALQYPATDICRRWFEEAMEAQGLEILQDWMNPCLVNECSEQTGYDMLTRYWGKYTHPDGLLLNDDIFCRGVLRAAVQLGIEFPRDLKLVSHANRDIPMPYHKSVTRVEYDSAEQARLAVDMMLTLAEGRKLSSTTIDLPGVLIKGETT